LGKEYKQKRYAFENASDAGVTTRCMRVLLLPILVAIISRNF